MQNEQKLARSRSAKKSAITHFLSPPSLFFFSKRTSIFFEKNKIKGGWREGGGGKGLEKEEIAKCLRQQHELRASAVAGSKAIHVATDAALGPRRSRQSRAPGSPSRRSDRGRASDRRDYDVLPAVDRGQGHGRTTHCSCEGPVPKQV